MRFPRCSAMITVEKASQIGGFLSTRLTSSPCPFRKFHPAWDSHHKRFENDRLKTGLRESRAAVARQVLVVPALFCVANCCCRGRTSNGHEINFAVRICRICHLKSLDFAYTQRTTPIKSARWRSARRQQVRGRSSRRAVQLSEDTHRGRPHRSQHSAPDRPDPFQKMLGTARVMRIRRSSCRFWFDGGSADGSERRSAQRLLGQWSGRPRNEALVYELI